MRRLVAALARTDILKRASLAFFATLGALSSVAQFFPVLQSLAVVVIAAVAVGAVVWALVASRQPSLPADDAAPLSGAIVTTPVFVLTTENGRAQLEQTHDLAVRVFPGVSPIPVDRYTGFLRVNPYVLACLVDRNREVAGYFDVFPLTPVFMEQLLSGAAGEADIRPHHLLPAEEAAHAQALYLGGIAVKDHKRMVGRRCASILVWGLLRYLTEVYPPVPGRRLYAEAATDEGESLLRAFEFELVGGRRGRKDPFRVYVSELDEPKLTLMRMNMPDWSSAVSVKWGKATV
jgi:hypothetical protein